MQRVSGNAVLSFPKPKLKKHRAKNNPTPTINDLCRYCLTPYSQTHEIYEGTGRRQLSIKYKMQVKVCDRCHKDIMSHPLTGKDLELKKEYQAKFESEHGHDLYMQCFMVDYIKGYE
jgi:hypothetical protein